MCCGNTQTTVQSQNVPAWLEDYYKYQSDQQRQQYDTAKKIYNDNAAYQPFPGERVQGFTGDQLTAFDMARQNAGIGGTAVGQPQLQSAVDRTTAASQSFGDRGGAPFRPQAVRSEDYSTQYNPTLAQTALAGIGDRVTSQNFDKSAADRYMSPYTDHVIDQAVGEVNRQAAMQRNTDADMAIKAGAYGGSRQAVLDAERERNRLNTIGDITANYRDKAFGQAANQFNADRGAGLTADLATFGAQNTASLANAGALNNNQQFNSGAMKDAFGINRDTFLQNRASDMDAQKTNQNMGLLAFNANRDQFNTDQNRLLQGGITAAQLGQQAQNMANTNANTMFNIGNMQQALGQQSLNTDFQNFLDQKNQPYQNLGFLQSALKAQPYSGVTSTSTTSPAPGFLGQLGGLGLTSLGVIGGTNGFGSNGWLSKIGN